MDESSVLWWSGSINYYKYHTIIVKVVLVTADWGLTEGRELSKHFTYIISFNIHNSPMGVDAIIPCLTGAETEAQRGEETGGARTTGE